MQVAHARTCLFLTCDLKCMLCKPRRPGLFAPDVNLFATKHSENGKSQRVHGQLVLKAKKPSLVGLRITRIIFLQIGAQLCMTLLPWIKVVVTHLLHMKHTMLHICAGIYGAQMDGRFRFGVVWISEIHSQRIYSSFGSWLFCRWLVCGQQRRSGRLHKEGEQKTVLLSLIPVLF